VQRRAAVRVQRVHVAGGAEQRRHRQHVAGLGGKVERRAAVAVAGLADRAVGEEQAQHRVVAAGRRRVQRGLVGFLVGGVDVRAVLEEHAGHFHVAGRGGHQQQRALVLVARLHGGGSAEKLVHALPIPALHRADQADLGQAEQLACHRGGPGHPALVAHRGRDVAGNFQFLGRGHGVEHVENRRALAFGGNSPGRGIAEIHLVGVRAVTQQQRHHGRVAAHHGHVQGRLAAVVEPLVDVGAGRQQHRHGAQISGRHGNLQRANAGRAQQIGARAQGQESFNGTWLPQVARMMDQHPAVMIGRLQQVRRIAHQARHLVHAAFPKRFVRDVPLCGTQPLKNPHGFRNGRDDHFQSVMSPCLDRKSHLDVLPMKPVSDRSDSHLVSMSSHPRTPGLFVKDE